MDNEFHKQTVEAAGELLCTIINYKIYAEHLMFFKFLF